jgi:hypothetical protein
MWAHIAQIFKTERDKQISEKVGKNVYHGNIGVKKEYQADKDQTEAESFASCFGLHWHFTVSFAYFFFLELF